jgi:hypothetical protein
MIGVQNRDVFISGLALGILYYFFPNSALLVFASIYLPLCFWVKKLKTANHLFWQKLSKILQAITHPVLLGAIFVLLLLPLGLLYRIFKSKKKQEESNFKEVHQTIDDSFFKVPW